MDCVEKYRRTLIEIGDLIGRCWHVRQRQPCQGRNLRQSLGARRSHGDTSPQLRFRTDPVSSPKASELFQCLMSLGQADIFATWDGHALESAEVGREDE